PTQQDPPCSSILINPSHLSAGGRWQKHHLIYRVVNWPGNPSRGQVALAVQKAFQLWSKGSADIRLAFYKGEHNDSKGNAFDGPGGALAMPSSRGEAHFDMAERWTLNGCKGHNLFMVSAHEVGHTLGLDHTVIYSDTCKASMLYYLADQDGTSLVFLGSLFWTVFPAGQTSSPLPLQNRWPGLPLTIEAAAYSKMDNKLYFFKGRRVWRYSSSNVDPGFPLRSSELGLPGHPDQVFTYRHLVVFKGQRYFVLNFGILTGVPQRANGALNHTDGHVYFFKEQQYWSFDPEKMQVTGGGGGTLSWSGQAVLELTTEAMIYCDHKMAITN
uniref:Peptidase metallopeptidase domain-containing protein n=1 Tax=Oncorhynchus tshawytscha TaxID=74940 RepID=A0AAZ3QEC8_ONCTS